MRPINDNPPVNLSATNRTFCRHGYHVPLGVEFLFSLTKEPTPDLSNLGCVYWRLDSGRDYGIVVSYLLFH